MINLVYFSLPENNNDPKVLAIGKFETGDVSVVFQYLSWKDKTFIALPSVWNKTSGKYTHPVILSEDGMKSLSEQCAQKYEELISKTKNTPVQEKAPKKEPVKIVDDFEDLDIPF